MKTIAQHLKLLANTATLVKVTIRGLDGYQCQKVGTISVYDKPNYLYDNGYLITLLSLNDSKQQFVFAVEEVEALAVMTQIWYKETEAN